MAKKIFILICAFCLIPSLIQARVEKTGNIIGIVQTPEGEPLHGVTVILESPAIVVPSLETITSELGKYRFVSLPPGEYGLIYSLPGIKKVFRNQIHLSAGKTVTIDIDMSLRAEDKFIIVEGKAPTIDALNKKDMLSFYAEFLQSLSFLLNIVSKIPQ